MVKNIDKSIENPLVTVLLPVYNGGNFLKETIQSILDQTYENFEFIIINDCSTDNSENIIQDFNDKRISYIKNNQNLELINTLNKGITISKGKYIVRIDADDIAHRERISRQVLYMEENSDVIVCGSNVALIKNNIITNEIIEYHSDSNDIKFALNFYCPFIHPSIIIRKEILIKNKLKFDLEFKHAEDYFLWTQLAAYGEFYNIPEVLTYYRLHEHQISHVNKQYQIEQMKRIQEIYQQNSLSYEFSLKERMDIFNLFENKIKQNNTKKILTLIKFLKNKSFKGNYKQRFVLNKIKNLILESKKLDFRLIFKLIQLYSQENLTFNIKQIISIGLKCL
jgi:glycosyltransferase involved in cell wall biosynthesis